MCERGDKRHKGTVASKTMRPKPTPRLEDEKKKQNAQMVEKSNFHFRIDFLFVCLLLTVTAIYYGIILHLSASEACAPASASSSNAKQFHLMHWTSENNNCVYHRNVAAEWRSERMRQRERGQKRDWNIGFDLNNQLHENGKKIWK